MAEISRPWDGTVTGDAGPYSDDQWSDSWLSLISPLIASEGVFDAQLNELDLSGVVTPVSIATGRALVDGTWYETNTVPVTVAIPTPGANPRVDRIVLRKNWAAQTIRITRIAGAEAASPVPPAIVQTDGVTWDLPIWQVHITVGGVITQFRDDRQFIGQYNVSAEGSPALVSINDDFFDGGSFADAERRRFWEANIPATAGNSISPSSAGGSPGRGVILLGHGAIAAEPVYLRSQVHEPSTINARLFVIAREPNTDANLDRVLGFTSDPTVILAAEMIAFYNDASVDGNWHAITRTGGVSAGSDTDTTIALSNTFKRLEIEVVGTQSVNFIIDGVVRATHILNVPVTASSLALQVRGAAGAPASQVYQHVDWVRLIGDRPSP